MIINFLNPAGLGLENTEPTGLPANSATGAAAATPALRTRTRYTRPVGTDRQNAGKEIVYCQGGDIVFILVH